MDKTDITAFLIGAAVIGGGIAEHKDAAIPLGAGIIGMPMAVGLGRREERGRPALVKPSAWEREAKLPLGWNADHVIAVNQYLDADPMDRTATLTFLNAVDPVGLPTPEPQYATRTTTKQAAKWRDAFNDAASRRHWKSAAHYYRMWRAIGGDPEGHEWPWEARREAAGFAPHGAVPPTYEVAEFVSSRGVERHHYEVDTYRRTPGPTASDGLDTYVVAGEPLDTDADAA